jgi:two-component system, OmpR family, sensor kinase
MFKSLRWRLQVWHAIVLLTVLTSFGGIVHSLHWQTRLQQVDAELDRTAGVVMSQLRRLLPRPPGGRPGGGRRIRRTDEANPEADTVTRPDANIAAATLRSDSLRNETSPENQTEQQAPPGPPRRDRFDPGPLPEEFQQLFHGDEESRLYFVIWGSNGDLLQKSESAPVIGYPNLHVGRDGLPIRIVRSRPGDQTYREVIHAGMFDMNLLVGRSLEKDLAAHHRSGFMLAAAGLVILAAGVLGGGWLSSRAILPIAEMTATAESISALDLSKRINVKETDSELGKLATVLNQTFDRLQSAFERQSQFTADASHELRTPLSVISAHTELALARPRSNEDYRGAIETCRRASQRMKSLIDALLLFARFDSGVPLLKQDSFDLKPLLYDCVELVEPLAAERQIQIECQPDSCYVCGDWDRLSQVVTNLLTNAIRYNVEGGQVHVATRTEGEISVLSVTDTGVGIEPEQVSRIFDRFYQVDKARSRAEGSSGLGLSICKTIVEAHHGQIEATSEVGVGTTLEVRLPRATVVVPAMGTTLSEIDRELSTK